MRKRLTATNITSLKADGGKRTDYTDTVTPGLVLRVSPGPDLTILAGMAFLIQVVLVDESRGAAHPLGDRE